MKKLQSETMESLSDAASVFVNEFVSVNSSSDGERVKLTVGTGRGAVSLVRSTSNILMIRTPRYATGSMEWALPRGGSMDDETVAETAVRCVEGWTGVLVDEGSVIHLGNMNPDPEILTTEVSLYAMEARGGKIRTNHEDSKWVAVEELVTACIEGEIEDSFTCIAVLRARISGVI